MNYSRPPSYIVSARGEHLSVTVDVRIELIEPSTIRFTQHLASAPSSVSTEKQEQSITPVLTAGSSMIAPGLSLPVTELQLV